MHKTGWRLSLSFSHWCSRPGFYASPHTSCWEFTAHLTLANLDYWFLNPLLCPNLMFLQNNICFVLIAGQGLLTPLSFLGRSAFYGFTWQHFFWLRLPVQSPLSIGHQTSWPCPPHWLLASSQWNPFFVDPYPEPQPTSRSYSFKLRIWPAAQSQCLPRFWAVFWYSLLIAIVRKQNGREQASHQHFPIFLGSIVLKSRTQHWDGEDKALYQAFA